MCRIFPWSQIAKGEIPQRQDFELAKIMVRANLPTMPGFVGGIIFGSVLMGKERSWSDLDLLVMYRAETTQVYRAALDFLSALTAKIHQLHIPLAVVPLEQTLAIRGNHTVTLGFSDHLRWASNNGGLIGEDPRQHIALKERRDLRLREASSYLTESLHSLMRGLATFGTLSEEERRKLLHKALDVPFHGSRRFLEVQILDCSCISRSGLLENVRERIPKAAKTLEEVLRHLSNYTTEVERQRKEPDEARYRACIAKLEKHAVHTAIQYLREVLECLR